MKEHWDIMKPAPHLALSIVGGAKNFKMDGRKREAFKTGLVSAARYSFVSCSCVICLCHADGVDPGSNHVAHKNVNLIFFKFFPVNLNST